MVRTRSAAASLVTAGHVRVNGDRQRLASRAVRAGDVLTVALSGRVRLVRVVGFAERRGDASTVGGLYEELGTPADGCDGGTGVGQPH